MRNSIESRLEKLEAQQQHETDPYVIACVHVGESEEQALARMGIDPASANPERCIFIY